MPDTPVVFWAVRAVDGAHGEDAVHGHGLEVGLNAGAAAGIAARDGKCSFSWVCSFIASQEISATFKQHICDMQFNAVAVALKNVEFAID